MAGLDKIIEDIRSESADAVAQIMKKAQDEHDAAMAEAKKEADIQTKRILAHGQDACSDLLARADSAASLERRRTILETKQSLIALAISRAKEAFLNLPDDEYFARILKLVKDNALEGEGQLCFNRRDFDRIPKDFAARLVAVLPGGARLDVARESAKIDGGFILKYDGIEQNLSVEEIFEEKKEQMQDLAGKLLFD